MTGFGGTYEEFVKLGSLPVSVAFTDKTASRGLAQWGIMIPLPSYSDSSVVRHLFLYITSLQGSSDSGIAIFSMNSRDNQVVCRKLETTGI